MRPRVRFFWKPLKTLSEMVISFTFAIYDNHVKRRWFHLCKNKPQQGCKFLFRLPQRWQATRSGGEGPCFLMLSWWQMTIHPRAIQIHTHTVLHFGSMWAVCKEVLRFIPEPKMPSSGNELKSQMAPKKYKWAESAGSSEVSWEPG